MSSTQIVVERRGSGVVVGCRGRGDVCPQLPVLAVLADRAAGELELMPFCQSCYARHIREAVRESTVRVMTLSHTLSFLRAAFRKDSSA